jgi:hypothetical protein
MRLITIQLTPDEVELIALALDTLHGKVGLDMNSVPPANEGLLQKYRVSLATIRQLRARFRRA